MGGFNFSTERIKNSYFSFQKGKLKFSNPNKLRNLKRKILPVVNKCLQYSNSGYLLFNFTITFDRKDLANVNANG